LQEASFVVGPSLAGIALLVSPGAALGAAAVITAAGAVAFTSAAAGPGHLGRAATPRGLGPIGNPQLQLLTGMSGLFGVAFGTLDVAVPAFAALRGSVAMAGPLLALLALGIATGGLLLGVRPARGRGFPAVAPLAGLAATGLALLLLAGSVADLAALIVVAGLSVGPALTTMSCALDDVVPSGTTAEAVAWTMSLFAAGTAIGAALSGQLVETGDLDAAFALAAGTVAAAAVLALLRPFLAGGRSPA
ncbi:MAG: hypothetical protein QOG42_1231, partial [Solirubrobacteraceae bacterium]|nr:hypothetical protein [Solirubrobacteraceae bacterium]